MEPTPHQPAVKEKSRNAKAQKAHRERKALYIKKLETRNAELELAIRQGGLADLLAEAAKLRVDLMEARARNEALVETTEHLKKALGETRSPHTDPFRSHHHTPPSPVESSSGVRTMGHHDGGGDKHSPVASSPTPNCCSGPALISSPSETFSPSSVQPSPWSASWQIPSTSFERHDQSSSSSSFASYKASTAARPVSLCKLGSPAVSTVADPFAPLDPVSIGNQSHPIQVHLNVTLPFGASFASTYSNGRGVAAPTSGPYNPSGAPDDPNPCKQADAASGGSALSGGMGLAPLQWWEDAGGLSL